MSQPFATIRSEGGLLPPDLLARIAQGDRTVPGFTPAAYRLDAGQQFGEAISRSWNRMLPTWHAFRTELAKLPSGDPATVLTREKLLQPLLQELGYGRVAPLKKAIAVDDREYAISHAWGDVPIHLLGAGTSLDERTAGQKGAAKSSPHGLVQDLLNRSDPHLWALLSNGLVLRLLRDHHSLTTQAYVEVDLEALFEGERYSDFALMWLVFHQSRIEPQEDKIDRCWLEQWFTLSRTEGLQALDDLRDGVVAAIEALGRGFLKHAHNTKLAEDLREGVLDRQDYYRELLRLVYRLIFLFSTEDRGVLLDPNASEAARDRYRKFYATRRLRDLAGQTRGGPHGDLWQALRAVMNGLDDGYPPLALPALGSFLWSKEAVPHLDRCELANADLLAALRALSYVERHKQRFPVSWRTVAADELGSVYESLLELHPKLDPFELTTAAGNERKKTGSYYTPTSLVDCLLDSALEPVIDSAIKGKSRADAEAALLALKVVDPACGSGHFLVAAARRLARRLATVRTGDDEPSPSEFQHALRDVVGHCIYGVDLNEMAVELCKVALWMEGVEPGRPLSFLDSHIQQGNALIGATPSLLRRGVPDKAWEALEGDDADTARALKKRNQADRKHNGPQPVLAELLHIWPVDSDPEPRRGSDSTLEQIRERARKWVARQSSPAFKERIFVADLWCAAFVWPKQPGELAANAPTNEIFRSTARESSKATTRTRRKVSELAREYGFFHWHLAFPDVFVPRGDQDQIDDDDVTGCRGGFDVVLGNPPWEHIEVRTKEHFHSLEHIADAPTDAARQKAIAALEESDPTLYRAYVDAVRSTEGAKCFVRNSGRYPLCGRGRVNTYAIFAELDRSLISATGRVGVILPSGIATDATTQHFFKSLLDSRGLASLHELENEGFFAAGKGHMLRFALTTIVGSQNAHQEADFVFQAQSVEEIRDPDRHFSLSKEDISLINPNTGTCPIFRTKRDADLCKGIYRRMPVLVRDEDPNGNPWSAILKQNLFGMSSQSDVFMTKDQLLAEGYRFEGNIAINKAHRALPLYEAKMVYILDHRHGDFADAPPGERPHRLTEIAEEKLRDPNFAPMPFFWAEEREVRRRLPDWHHEWLLGWRDVTDARASARTVIPAVVPYGGALDSFSLLLTPERHWWVLAASLASLVLDFVARQKVGGIHLRAHIFKQLPFLRPEQALKPCPWSPSEDVAEWTRIRLLELIYTTTSLSACAKEMGWDGPPFVWNQERRFALRSELDAAFFHLYGLDRADTAYVLDTFPVLRDKELREYGEFRTKRVVLEHYDALAEAIATQSGHVGPSAITTRVMPVAVAAETPAFATLASATASSGAWATPEGADNSSTTLVVLTEVLRLTPDFVDAQRVRWAVLLAQRPALATPLLSDELRQKWQQLVGVEATPRPADVAGLDQFRKAPDRAFGTYVTRLKSSNHLVVDGERWRGAANLPASRFDWVSGRAATAVEIARGLDLATASEVVANLVAKAATG